jgi:NTE family protein
MAISMPLFFDPVRLGSESWCDGGIVDILPAHPVLELEPPCPTTLAVNVFYPPGLAGEDATGWDFRTASILRAASQVRTSQHLQLARDNLRRLRERSHTLLLEPVPYEAVRGTGFYRQFLDASDWPAFMRAGYDATRAALVDGAVLPSPQPTGRTPR